MKLNTDSGNIRSVNVDYFEPNSSPEQQLESAVLSAIGELARKEPDYKAVHIGQLLEHLKPRLGQTTPVSLLDRTINRLVRDGRLCLRPMTQQQVAETLADRQTRLQAAQSVFLDQLIAPASSLSNSTTLDSGVQSMSVPSPTYQASNNFRSSLGRSLSFRASRAGIVHAEAGNTADPRGPASAAKSLAGLLRSRSMRVISSARRAASEKRPQATIDYLSADHARRRATSVHGRMRESSASRFGLFLRRLFAGRRQQGSQPKQTLDSVLVEPTIRQNSLAATHTSRSRSNLARVAPIKPAHELTSLSPANRPSSSSSSSGANSLLEILDCSPEFGDSRRQLRHEPAPTATNRASWRLIKRSDSSLSHNSIASSSTTKSTASQQLRRHLDEAYRRHRTCTSQRDKEFIDSINILRQASRHALQSSRSSSKNRRAKSATNSDDTASSLDSACDSPAHLCRENNQDLLQSDEERLSRCCECPAQLCPLACLPYGCCLGSHQSEQLTSSDLCCPIWRSLLAKYWPPTFPYTHGDPNFLLPPQLNHSIDNRGNLVNSQQHQHQHQHNTTIDLKIEIGSNLRNKHQTITATTPSCVIVEPSDDSLESYHSRGSTSRTQGLETSSLENELLSDSLQNYD